jgi:hypothetical protein
MAGAAKRFLRLEAAQRETNATLLRIEGTLATSSRLFELMHMRLEHLEDGQLAVVDRLERLENGQSTLVEGQKSVVERLDRLVAAAARERTERAEQLGKIEGRLENVERRLEALEDD